MCIRKEAYKFRKIFGFENKLYFPIVEIMEYLSNKGRFNLEICDINEMKLKCGETISSENIIKIREDIYGKACKGDGFSRSTFSHELLHWLRHGKNTVSFCRRKDLEKRKAYEDTEWQANCFSGELLVPKHLVKYMSVEEVMKKCGVSYSMTKYQLEKYEKEGWNEI